MKTNKFLSTALALLLSAAVLFPAAGVQAASTGIPRLTVGHLFGYSFDVQPASPDPWVELAGDVAATSIDFTLPDDAIELVDIGFTFPYFEGTYSVVKVSTNGFLMLGQDQLDLDAFSGNKPLGTEFRPNGVIAAFWDDLDISGIVNETINRPGAVLYRMVGTEPNRRFIIEWHDVFRFGEGDDESNLITFEIILEESGAIELNYRDLGSGPGPAVAGIEDAEGVDSLPLAIQANTNYRSEYPSNPYGVKAFPVYQGAFTVNGQVDLPLKVFNIGTLNDTYSFDVQLINSTPSGWSAQVLNSAKAPLAGGILAVTGLNQAQIYVRVSAPTAAVLGDFVQGSLTVTSVGDPNKAFTTTFQAAVPTPFTAMYVDGSTGTVRNLMPRRQVGWPVFNVYTGSTFALTGLTNITYLTSRTVSLQNGSANIVTSISGVNRGVLRADRPVEDHSGIPVTDPHIRDSNAVTARLSDGSIGMVFIREEPNLSTGRLKTNIYYTRFFANENQLLPPVQVTFNQEMLTYSKFSTPTISAAGVDRVAVAYEQNSDTAKDIVVHILDNMGTVKSTHEITDSSGESYNTPTLFRLVDGRVFLAFMREPAEANAGSEPPLVQYATITAIQTTPVVGTLRSFEAGGTSLQSALYATDKLLLAWVKADATGVDYKVFTPQDLTDGATPTTRSLPGVNGWLARDLSITRDLFNHAVLSWVDGESYYLCYALIDDTGNPLTPPMTFLRGSGAAPILLFSSIGRGVAPLENLRFSFLPSVSRK